MINAAKTDVRNVVDYKLSRLAYCLIVQNTDPSKEVFTLVKRFCNKNRVYLCEKAIIC